MHQRGRSRRAAAYRRRMPGQLLLKALEADKFQERLCAASDRAAASSCRSAALRWRGCCATAAGASSGTRCRHCRAVLSPARPRPVLRRSTAAAAGDHLEQRDLPQPDGPTTTKNSPSVMWKSSGRSDGTRRRASDMFSRRRKLDPRRFAGAVGQGADARPADRHRPFSSPLSSQAQPFTVALGQIVIAVKRLRIVLGLGIEPAILDQGLTGSCSGR